MKQYSYVTIDKNGLPIINFDSIGSMNYIPKENTFNLSTNMKQFESKLWIKFLQLFSASYRTLDDISLDIILSSISNEISITLDGSNIEPTTSMIITSDIVGIDDKDLQEDLAVTQNLVIAIKNMLKGTVVHRDFINEIVDLTVDDEKPENSKFVNFEPHELYGKVLGEVIYELKRFNNECIELSNVNDGRDKLKKSLNYLLNIKFNKLKFDVQIDEENPGKLKGWKAN